MAGRIFYGTQSLQPELKIMPGSFTTNGASDPTVTTGTGFSVARSGTGKWTVTFDDTYPGILSVMTNFMITTWKTSAARLRWILLVQSSIS